MSSTSSAGGDVFAPRLDLGAWLLAESLRAELLAIEGIATAELDGDETAPLGVRVQLAAGADPASVGVAVERVLASHGMRSHRAEEEAAAGQAVAEEAIEDEAKSSSVGGPPPPPGAASNNGDASVLPMRRVVEEPVERVEPVEPDVTFEATLPQLESVSVEESRRGIAVRVTLGGESVTRQVGTSPDGMDAAIVGALTQLLGIEAELVAAQRGEAGAAKMITVLVDVAGRGQHVGSALVVASDAYAVAQAAWKALTAQE